VFDFSGSPTITLPNGTASNRMPLSVQLVGRHLSEDLLTPAAHAFQSTSPSRKASEGFRHHEAREHKA
jgi:amidase